MSIVGMLILTFQPYLFERYFGRSTNDVDHVSLVTLDLCWMLCSNIIFGYCFISRCTTSVSSSCKRQTISRWEILNFFPWNLTQQFGNRSTLHSTLWKLRTGHLLSSKLYFGKNFVKPTYLLKKLLNGNWFDEIFFQLE